MMDILIFAETFWNSTILLDKQRIASKIVQRGHRVLYIEQSTSLYKSMLSSNRRKYFFSGLREIQPNLYAFALKRIGLSTNAWLRRNLNQPFIVHQIKKLMNKLEFKKTIFWSFSPGYVDFIGKLGEYMVIYHCTDDYSALPSAKGQERKIQAMERCMADRSDIIFATAPTLFERLKVINKNTFFIPHGVDVEIFGSENLRRIPLAKEMERLQYPIIGFIGAVSRFKIDFELIDYIALRRPEWTILMIGPIGIEDGTKQSDLPQRKNIIYLGFKPLETLPSYLKKINVCIIPYDLNKYTWGVFPLKLFEYMATGKPVVTTDLPAIREYGAYIRVAKDKDDFIECINGCLKYDTDEAVSRRIDLALENTWDRRVESLIEVVESFYRANVLDNC